MLLEFILITLILMLMTAIISVTLTVVTMKMMLSSKRYRKVITGPQGPVGPMGPRGSTSTIEDITLYYKLSDSGIPIVVKGTYRDNIFHKTNDIKFVEDEDFET